MFLGMVGVAVVLAVMVLIPAVVAVTIGVLHIVAYLWRSSREAHGWMITIRRVRVRRKC